MKRILFSLFALLLVASTAEARWYQVELIIFSHLTPQSLTQEQWPNINPDDFNLNRGISLQEADPDQQDQSNSRQNYQLIPKSQYKLKQVQRALDKHPDYQTLLHLAWQQQGLSLEDADTIHLEGGEDYGDHHQVEGSIRIGVKRYFNVTLDLLFAAPSSELASIADNDYFAHAGKLVYFHLAQTRRMRSNELNYIDYPLYGVLIKIVPLEQKSA